MSGHHELDPQQLRRSILTMTHQRSNGSVCPSEVARHLVPEGSDRWRSLMEPVREQAWCLVDAGLLVITQGGTPVDRESLLPGPIRLACPPRGTTPPADSAVAQPDAR